MYFRKLTTVVLVGYADVHHVDMILSRSSKCNSLRVTWLCLPINYVNFVLETVGMAKQFPSDSPSRIRYLRESILFVRFVFHMQ